MGNLKNFTHAKERKPPRVTLSVNLEKTHRDWLKKNAVNLSKLVRALIEKAMRGEDLDL